MIKRLTAAVMLLAVIAHPVAAKPVSRPVVEGYLPSIRGVASTLAATDLKPYTDIALAFVNPNAQGQITNGTAMACMTDRYLVPVPTQTVSDAVTTIHAAGARAIGALAGALLPVCAGDWDVLAGPAHRDATVSALVAFADAEKLDGLSVDIEADLLNKMVKDGTYVPFVKALSARLHAHHKTLSGTTASYVGGMIPIGAIPAFDTVEVMTYDNAVPGQEEAAMADYKSALYLWLGRGVQRDRLILGVPFYGRGYGTYRPAYAYRDLGTVGTANGDLIGEMCATCSYVTFNAPQTLTDKAHWARAKAGGVMAWEISEDTTDGVLVKAVMAGLANPSPLPTPVVATTPQPAAGAALNRPDGQAWTIYGSGETYAPINDATVPGGRAVRVTVAKPTENAWDIGVSAPISGAIAAGDTVDIAVWARLNAADPDTQLDVPISLAQTKAPYGELVIGDVTLTTQWQLVHIHGPVPTAQASGAVEVVLSLGGAAKVVDLGAASVVATNRQK